MLACAAVLTLQTFQTDRCVDLGRVKLPGVVSSWGGRCDGPLWRRCEGTEAEFRVVTKSKLACYNHLFDPLGASIGSNSGAEQEPTGGAGPGGIDPSGGSWPEPFGRERVCRSAQPERLATFEPEPEWCIREGLERGPRSRQGSVRVGSPEGASQLSTSSGPRSSQ